MKQNYSRKSNDSKVTIRMDITLDVPEDIAYMAEQLGIYSFDRCTYDLDTRRLTASVTTTLYKEAA